MSAPLSILIPLSTCPYLARRNRVPHLVCHPERCEGPRTRLQRPELRKAFPFLLYQAFTTCLEESLGASAGFLPSFGSQLIIPRSCAPTISMGCCFSFSRSALNFGQPFLFSAIHSRANS